MAKNRVVFTEEEKKVAEKALVDINELTKVEAAFRDAISKVGRPQVIALRKMSGLSQAGLAKAMGKTKGWISRIENGADALSIAYVFLLKDIVMARIAMGVALKAKEKLGADASNDV